MTAFYNENDRFACDWLSNLMDAGLITPGKIDDRSIVAIRPDELAAYERVHFFAGIGGWDHALNLAGWRRPVWTGSCPCQPFSQAGQRAGFDDERHLWPFLRNLIAERRPATFFGEQVASASDWLRLVRGDLEALDYAVGAIPFQAASAGADHLRDRYGIVAHTSRSRGSAWLPASASGREGFAKILDDRSGGLAGLGRQRLADADQLERRVGDEQPARQQPEHERDATSRDGRDVGNANSAGAGRNGRSLAGPEAPSSGAREANRHIDHESLVPSSITWAIGADGKARRVKSGIRLLVDAFPNRMGLLRGFGNAIDPKAFAEFIAAADEAMTALSSRDAPDGAGSRT
jgi:DNA (cytosine-5)-methyltransferase 1